MPQLRVSWDLHERLWPVKFVIFLFLFGMSLYSIAAAEQLSEVEPFKTAIVLKFFREWLFVLYAVALLVAGLFVERFFAVSLPARSRAGHTGSPGHVRMVAAVARMRFPSAAPTNVQSVDPPWVYQRERMHLLHALPGAILG